MPISAVDSIGPAFQHAKKQLIKPFRLGQWSRLALVGLLAGELGSGGSCNFRVPAGSQRSGGTENFLAPHFPNFPSGLMAHAGLITLLVVVGIILFFAFMYVSSIMRFILFDSVVEKDCRIRKGWTRNRLHGQRYFLWQFLLMMASMVVIVILIGIPVAIGFTLGWLKNPGQHILPLVLGGIVLIFVFSVAIASLMLVVVLTKDFVVPQMALENISAFEGWRRLWKMMQQEKGGYAAYIGMKIVMAMGAAIISLIVILIIFVGIVLFAVAIGLAAGIGAAAAGLTWNLYTITLAVVAGSIALVVLLYLLSLLSVPFIVFFPAYSIYFFAVRYPALAAVLYPVSHTTPESPLPPPGTPPSPFFPPEPEAIG